MDDPDPPDPLLPSVFPEPPEANPARSAPSPATTLHQCPDPSPPSPDLSIGWSLSSTLPGFGEFKACDSPNLSTPVSPAPLLGRSSCVGCSCAGTCSGSGDLRPVLSPHLGQASTSSDLKDVQLVSRSVPPSLSPCTAGGLSPSALPFLPSGCSVGRSKLRQWTVEDETDEVGDLLTEGEPSSVAPPSTSPGSKHSVDVQLSLSPRLVAPARPLLNSILVRAGDGGPGHGRQAALAQRRRGRRRRRHQLVHGLPLRGDDNRPRPQRVPVPAQQRIGPRVSRHHCVTAPNMHGWHDILRRGQPELQRSPNLREGVQAPGMSPAALVRFRGRCFRCLSRDHKVASCRDPLRCFRCNGSGHLSKHCPVRRRLDSRQRVLVIHDQQANRRSAHERLCFDEFPPLGGASVSPGMLLPRIAVMVPNTFVAPKLVDFGDWMPPSPSSCHVPCTSLDPMLEEAALLPLPDFRDPVADRGEPGECTPAVSGDIQSTSDDLDDGAQNALCTPPRPAGSRSLAEEIESLLCLPLQTPIIRSGPKLRKSKTPSAVFTLRRSERLARKPRAANSTLQAQNVLMQKLGVVVSTNNVDAEVVEKFRATFAAPLSASKLEALQALFAGDLDPIALNLDLTGFDAEDI